MRAVRNTLAAVLLLTAAQALAQQNDRNLVDRVIRLSADVNEAVRRNAYDLNNRQLEVVEEHLREVQRQIRGGGGRPDPRPPGPGPRPPGNERHLVRGTIETTSFSFEVSSLEDLNDQCVTFYSGRYFGNVDEIHVSVDFGTSRRLYNSSSYWKTAQAVCGQIVSAARQEGIRLVSLRHRYIVTGEIETTGYTFKGQSLIDLNQQCEAFYQGRYFGNVDEIYVSVNFEPSVRKYNSSSYWRTSFEVCQQILSEVRN